MALADTASDAAPVPGVVAVMLVDHQPRHRAWAWLQLARGGAALAGTPGLRFGKVMGSGEGGGFSMRPSATHLGLVALFDTLAQAQAFLAGPRAQAHRERARHWWTGLLAVTEARGSWDGCAWAPTADAAQEAPAQATEFPVAALTRAAIRPARLAHFWRHAPAAQQAVQDAAGCGLAMGLGEAPLLRQCTFSLWRGESDLVAYARGAAHGQAAQAAWRQDYFSESMFVRMRLLASDGQWPRTPQAADAALAPADG